MAAAVLGTAALFFCVVQVQAQVSITVDMDEVCAGGSFPVLSWEDQLSSKPGAPQLIELTKQFDACNGRGNSILSRAVRFR